jgi:hypothetical protein
VCKLWDKNVLTDQARTPITEHTSGGPADESLEHTYISKISVQNFDVTVNDLQCHQLVVSRPNAADEE